MNRVPSPIVPERKRMLKAVRAEFKRLQRVLGRQLAALPDEELRNVNVAQNVMRDCLTAVLHDMMPYSHLTAVELSRRLASYALSVVPMEDQEVVVAEHLDGFADFHMQRTAAGQIIASEWKMEDGREQPNFPKEQTND